MRLRHERVYYKDLLDEPVDSIEDLHMLDYDVVQSVDIRNDEDLLLKNCKLYYPGVQFVSRNARQGTHLLGKSIRMSQRGVAERVWHLD